ncbi:MAG: hypothetical protein JWL71_167 [Acidobacteria bacterium]|nr:hypothetical protein [Acidobacteriota bacterium]
MIIVPVRSVCLAGLLALTAACGAVHPGSPLQLDRRLERSGLPPIDVRFTIQPDHARARERYVVAAMAALTQSGEWLGASPLSSLTVLDPPLHGAIGTVADDVVVLDRTPAWSTATSMTPELAAARGVTRRCLAALVDTRALPPWFVDALVESAARRVVAGLFEQENPPGYAFYEERYFGRFVPRATRIHLRQESDGDPLPAYRAGRAADSTKREAKAVLTLGTLERWVGRPVFDQLIAEFVRARWPTPPTMADFVRVASDVSAQDLSWLFDEAFGSERVFDYGVERFTSEPDAGGGFTTTIVARRYGDARFPGTSAKPVGGFESGRGITVQVRFADGQRRRDVWDGRDPARTFRYRSAVRAAAAEVDPDRTLLLDVAQTNNSITLSPQSGTAASRWAARWLGWLSHALLTYAALV